MNCWRRILLWSLVVLLLGSAALPVLAAGEQEALPPLPQWPVIGPLLRWLGLAPRPKPTPTPPPTPTMPEYQLSQLSDWPTLARALKAGERVRVYATATDIQAAVETYLNSKAAQRHGVHSATVTLGENTIQVQGTIDRATLEKAGLTLPLLTGDTVHVAAKGTPGAANCQLTITLQEVRVNDQALPLLKVASRLLNEALAREWPAEACVESVQVTAERVTVTGYRRESQ